MGGRYSGNSLVATPVAMTIAVKNYEERAQFAVERADLNLPEQTAANVAIGQPFTATDGDNDPLTYGLEGVWGRAGSADTADARFFAIDANGQLKTKAVLDYEAPQDQDGDNVYEVTVTVHDGMGVGLHSFSSTSVDDRVAVTIRVQGIDEAGRVTLSPQPLVNVPYTVTLSDPDALVSGPTWQWARSQTQGNWVNIDGATTATYTPVAADKDYYLQVRATYTDTHGHKTLLAGSANPVAKKDENEPPAFDEGTAATRTVAETTPSGDPIGAPVTATDPDDHASLLVYALSGPDARFFAVGADGQLTVGAGTVLDYETRQTYTVTVTVTDPSNDTDTITVTIRVTDVNEAPAFAAATARRGIVEQTAAGVAIGQPLTATDDDNDPLTYTLAATGARTFAIDSTSGQLRTKAALDHETQQTYTVTVMVSDGQLDARIEVTIDVTDAGAVTLSATQPQVGSALTAEVSDPDGLAAGVLPTWRWEWSTDGSQWEGIEQFTATYTPRAADAGRSLRVTASYTDGDGTFKEVTATTQRVPGQPSGGGDEGGSGGGGGGSDEEPPPAEPVGYLENPGPASFQSGIGILSGWVCAAEGVAIEVGDLGRQEVAYGMERGDTASVCGDTDNGFGLLFNWNRLGDGEHAVVAYVDGVELDRATVTVTTLGQEFVRDVAGECEAADFPMDGEMVTLVWQQSSQNFVLAAGAPPSGESRTGTAGVGVLENPGSNSFQSGIGVLSGWVCEAEVVTLAIGDLPVQEAGYGTERLDTQDACGDTDNGFGLLFNWNRLGDGEHAVVAYVDGEELGRATVRVTTLGEEFLRDVAGECVVEDFPSEGETVTLEWQQSSQNFVLTDVE